MNSNQPLSFEYDFFDILANKPYCTDELGVTFVRPKKTAITKKYLQVNQPKMAYYLVFDIDREGAVFAWYDENLPSHP